MHVLDGQLTTQLNQQHQIFDNYMPPCYPSFHVGPGVDFSTLLLPQYSPSLDVFPIILIFIQINKVTYHNLLIVTEFEKYIFIIDLYLDQIVGKI